MITPNSIAKLKPRSTSPPRTYSTIRTMIVVSAGNERARQRLVDRQIDQVDERHGLVLAHVLADAVEHDHAVVDRVAGNRQHGGDDGQVELDPEQREHADDGDDSRAARTMTPESPNCHSKRNQR